MEIWYTQNLFICNLVRTTYDTQTHTHTPLGLVLMRRHVVARNRIVVFYFISHGLWNGHGQKDWRPMLQPVNSNSNFIVVVDITIKWNSFEFRAPRHTHRNEYAYRTHSLDAIWFNAFHILRFRTESDGHSRHLICFTSPSIAEPWIICDFRTFDYTVNCRHHLNASNSLMDFL